MNILNRLFIIRYNLINCKQDFAYVDKDIKNTFNAIFTYIDKDVKDTFDAIFTYVDKDIEDNIEDALNV